MNSTEDSGTTQSASIPRPPPPDHRTPPDKRTAPDMALQPNPTRRRRAPTARTPVPRLPALLVLVAALALQHAPAAAQAPDPADVPESTSPNGFVNVIQKPVLADAAFVHTRQFAQLPPELGLPAKIVSFTRRGRLLFVCTLLSVYEVSPRGDVIKFLDIAGAITRASRGTRNISLTNLAHGGVRSIAFPSRFPRDPRFYVSAMETRPQNITGLFYLSDVDAPTEADSVLLEFRYSSRRRRVDPLSYRSLFRVGMRVYDHPIKQIVFRWDLLYVAHGDGAAQNASLGGGQNRDDALGKILRVAPLVPRVWRGAASRRLQRARDALGLRRYAIPASNPFVDDPDALDEVWALGFRNPHTLCFGDDGKLYVGETGRSNVEEVNIARRGRDYGWSAREGQFVQDLAGGLVTGVRKLPDDDASLGYEYPAAVYGHNGVRGKEFTTQAVAGGCPVENGSPLSGNFFYTDFPLSGRLFFSALDDLAAAVTRGPPDALTTADTKLAVVCLRRRTAAGGWETLRVNTLGNATRVDSALTEPGTRADIRLGQGRFGELYWSSKTNGRIYKILSSLPGGPDGPC